MSFQSSQPAESAAALRVSKWTLFSYIGPIVLAGAVGGYVASGPLWAASLAAGLLVVLLGGILWSPPYRAALLQNSPVIVIGPIGIDDFRRGLTIRWDQVASIEYREAVAGLWLTRRFLGVLPVEGAALPERRLEPSEWWTTRKAPELRTYLRDVQVGLGGIRVKRAELGEIIRRYYKGDLQGFSKELDSPNPFTPEEIRQLEQLGDAEPGAPRR